MSELKLHVGDLAPDFSASTHNGKIVRLSDLRGRFVVLYFYPKDITPGCTVEACAFRDRWERIRSLGAVVLGVNTDSVKSHERFARLFRLPFPLLADPERKIVSAYGVHSPNSMLGWLGMGTRRVTFLIGPDGRICEIWPQVSVSGHAAEVLAAIERHRISMEGDSKIAAPFRG
jgi:peroxiredoxin Q/BCP